MAVPSTAPRAADDRLLFLFVHFEKICHRNRSNETRTRERQSVAQLPHLSLQVSHRLLLWSRARHLAGSRNSLCCCPSLSSPPAPAVVRLPCAAWPTPATP